MSKDKKIGIDVEFNANDLVNGLNKLSNGLERVKRNVDNLKKGSVNPSGDYKSVNELITKLESLTGKMKGAAKATGIIDAKELSSTLKLLTDVDKAVDSISKKAGSIASIEKEIADERKRQELANKTKNANARELSAKTNKANSVVYKKNAETRLKSEERKAKELEERTRHNKKQEILRERTIEQNDLKTRLSHEDKQNALEQEARSINVRLIKAASHVYGQGYTLQDGFKDLTSGVTGVLSSAPLIRSPESVLANLGSLTSIGLRQTGNFLTHNAKEVRYMSELQKYPEYEEYLRQYKADNKLEILSKSEQKKAFRSFLVNGDSAVKDDDGNYKRLRESALTKLTSDAGAMKAIGMAGLGPGLTIAALAGLGIAIKNLGEESVEAYEKIQSLQVQLGVVYGSQSESNEAFSQIEAYAKKSPFGVEVMTQQAVLLKQSGVLGSDLMDTMGRIGDLASGNAEKMRSISEVYARILSSTTVTARDMRQLANAGVPSYRALTDSFKSISSEERTARGLPETVRQSQIRSMLQTGKVTSEDFQRMIKILTDEGGTFYRAVEKGSKTIAARKQNLSDAKEMARSAIGEVVTTFGGTNTGNSWYGSVLSTLEDIYAAEERWATKWAIKNRIKDGTNDSNFAIIASKNEKVKDIFEAVYGPIDNYYKEAMEKQLSSKALAYEEAKGYYDSRLTKEQTEYLKNLESVDQQSINKQKAWAQLGLLAPVVGGIGGFALTAGSVPTYISSVVSEKAIQDPYAAIVKEKGYIKDGDYDKVLEDSEYIFAYLSSALGKFVTSSKDAAKTLIDASSSISNRIVKAKTAEENSSYNQMLKKEEQFFRDIALKNEIENAIQKTGWRINEEGIAVADLKKATGAAELNRFRELLTSNAEKIPMEYQDLFFNDKLTDKGLENVKQFKNNLNEFEAASFNQFRHIPEARDEFIKMQNYLTADKERFTQTSYKGFAEAVKKFPSIIQKAIESGRISETVGQAIITAFNGSGSSRTLENPNNKDSLGKRLEPNLWQNIIGDNLGVPAETVKKEGNTWTLKTYKDNLSKRNEFSTVAQALLSTGTSLGEISSKMVRTGTGPNETVNFNWVETMKSLEEMAGGGNIQVREALIDEYQKQIDLMNTLEVAGVATTDEWNNLQQASEILGSGFSLSAEKLADGTYRFTEQTIESAEKIKKEFEAKKFSQAISLAFEKTIDNTRSSLIQEKLTGSIYKGQLGGSGYKSEDEVNLLVDAYNQIIDTQRKEGFKNLRSAYDNSTSEKFKTDIDSYFNSLSKYEGYDKGEDRYKWLSENISKLEGGDMAKLIEVMSENGILNELSEELSKIAEELKKKRKENATAKFVDSTNKKLLGATGWRDEDAIEGNPYANLDKSDPNYKLFQLSSKSKMNEILGFDKHLDFNTGIKWLVEEQVKPENIKRTGDLVKASLLNGDIPTLMGTDNQTALTDKDGNHLTKDDILKKLEQFKDKDSSELFNDLKGYDGFDEFLAGIDKAQAGTELLKGEMESLGEAITEAFSSLASDSIVRVTDKIGRNTYKLSHDLMTSAEASKEMDKELKNIAADLLSSISQSAVTAGLNIASGAALSGNWGMVAVGLGLAAAGGFGNFLGGYLKEAIEDDKTDDRLARLETLKENLANLLAQARQDAIYYETTLRDKQAISANNAISSLYATKVNDMILTDKGVFSTDPKDTIMAMKDPGSLVRGDGGSPVFNLKIVNESGQQIQASEVSSSKNKYGGLDIEAVITSVVKKGVVNGEFDSAFDAMNARQQGQFVSG